VLADPMGKEKKIFSLHITTDEAKCRNDAPTNVIYSCGRKRDVPKAG
jgi:hypothetical protein